MPISRLSTTKMAWRLGDGAQFYSDEFHILDILYFLGCLFHGSEAVIMANLGQNNKVCKLAAILLLFVSLPCHSSVLLSLCFSTVRSLND